MKFFSNNILPLIVRCFIALLGGIWALLQPTLPFILICTLAILCDCYSAWDLSRRVKKLYPESSDGKFKSKKAGKVIRTLLEVYAFIVFAYLAEQIIFEELPCRLVNIAAGAVCFWQGWSVLENKSSCNDAKWARVVQKIMVDKTERHFDIDLSELRKISEENIKKEEERNYASK